MARRIINWKKMELIIRIFIAVFSLTCFFIITINVYIEMSKAQRKIIMEERNNEMKKYRTEYMTDSNTVKSEPIKVEYDKSKTSVEIIDGTVTNTSADILIIDNNENPALWGNDFKIQKYEDDTWVDCDTKNSLNESKIQYKVDENNQFKETINWEEKYGILESGRYRIVKKANIKYYIYVYSNEFEIK